MAENCNPLKPLCDLILAECLYQQCMESHEKLTRGGYLKMAGDPMMRAEALDFFCRKDMPTEWHPGFIQYYDYGNVVEHITWMRHVWPDSNRYLSDP